MSDPVSLASLFDAAEQAAMGGDFAAAARLLAEAARAQEATLGPDHLDLANTLNNLAVAHERCGQLDAAEREYRRAHAIAARALPADDPLVTTSAQNLRDFCEANGRSVDGPALRLADDGDPGADAARAIAMAEPFQADIPTAPIERLAMTFAGETSPPQTPPVSTAPVSTAPVPVSPGPERPRPDSIAAGPSAADPTKAGPAKADSLQAGPTQPGPTPARTPATAPTSTGPGASAWTPAPAPGTAAAARHAPSPVAPAPPRRPSIPVLVGLGALAVLVMWLLVGRDSSAPPATPQAAPRESAETDKPAATATPPRPTSAVPTPPPASTRPPSSAATTAAADGVVVDDAKLCTSLSPSYQCAAAGATVRPGRLVFYTRLLATRDTSVVHRWYRGNDLRQAVRLDVAARRQGFRTFSRGTVSPSEAEWRVELRTRDGQLLHTERFTVR
jgi:hypothetical protein